WTLPGATDDPLAWLEQLLGPQTPRPVQWLMAGGEPGGAALPPPGAPYLQATWRAPLADHQPLADSVVQLQREFVQQHRTMLPTMAPLIAGDMVVVRGPTGLRAIDLHTGQLRWESPALNSLWYLLRFGDQQQWEAQRDAVADGLRQRLWEDPAFGSLSSDGQRALVVEDLGFRLAPGGLRAVVRADGRRQIDTAALEEFNQLAAYDLRTGKVAWEIGGPPDGSSQPLAGGRFQGPPLPLGDQLYAVVEFPEQALLVALHAGTGEVTEQWVLEAGPDDEATDESAKSPLVAQPVRSAPGSTPVYADGLVVCRTSRNRFLAVDLATRTVRWAYASPPAEQPANLQMMPLAQRRQFARQLSSDRADQWCGGGALIANGHVLLTPAETDSLVCLRLEDGQHLWTAPRQDGLYLGGVSDGRVVVVGRGGLYARRLADGQVDPVVRATWPPGSVPSGRGYLSQGRLYVPLTTAEIAVYDVADGRLLARSQSVTESIPGNLVRLGDYVVSCDPAGLQRFETLDALAHSLAARTGGPDTDLPAFLKLTEVLLYQGQVEQALARLRQVDRSQAPAEVARLTAEALMQLTDSDWEAHHELAAEVDKAIADPLLRERFLRRLALAYRDSGQWDAAFDACLKLADLPVDPELMLPVTANLTARRDRYLQGLLADLVERAPPEVRQRNERRIEERLRAESSEAVPPTLLQALDFHPAADALRLRLARQWAEQPQRRLAAELLLRRVLQRGTATDQAAASAQLAELLRAAGKPLEAARFYQHLGGSLADTVCLDGQTGRQLLAALPADDPVRDWLDGRQPWPLAAPEKQVETIPPNKATQHWNSTPIWVTGDGSPWSPRVYAAYDAQTQKMLGYDAQGTRQWELAPPRPDIVQFGINTAQGAGHLLLVQLGTRLVAIDQLNPGEQPLWSADTLQVDMSQWWLVP
ncbi:MAG: PQQ-binding-like beta-propeller repeat protein, partial [Pirellulaceae bacterium]|nr:PQQ-binding-like beta-propeller repeat protein [Pirellulaceae bacterium]